MSNEQAHSGIWVPAEIRHGKITPATFELLGEAVRLAAANADKVTAVLWGGGLDPLIGELGRAGADRVIAIEDSRFDVFRDELQAETLAGLTGKYRPAVMLLQASSLGRALAPRVAALCHTGLTADCTDLAIDPVSGALLQTRPAFGGSLLATIRTNGYFPQMATVRPGVMRPLAAARTGSPEVVRESAPADRWSGLKTVLAGFGREAEEPSFDGAGAIVSGGRGLNGEGFALLRRFAELSGAAVGASRAAVDANLIGYPHQVGQTGRTVRPGLYIAFGISGQIQHLAGMQNCEVLVAVNTDPDAPLMKLADLAVVGDTGDILRQMINQFQTDGEEK